jgi:CBS domain containing-hemolysin-like protein
MSELKSNHIPTSIVQSGESGRFMKISLPESGWVMAAVAASVCVTSLAFGLEEPPRELSNSHVPLLIAYVLLALLFSFLCSVAEAALLSITPLYIEGEMEKRPKRARLLKQLKQDNVDRSLAAILTLNTIAHTVGAIGAGAQATLVFGNTWFGLFSVAMTLMILFFSEIIPKTIGAIYWSRLVGPTVFFVRTLIVMLFPIVWLSEKMTKVISRGKDITVFSRDEFMAMARVGAETGDIKDNESRIIRNLMQLRSLRVSDVMTPSTVISALSEDLTITDALQQIAVSPFSRLPVFKTDIDDITGFVLRDDVLLKKARGKGDGTLGSLKRDIFLVPETISVSILLERFLKNRQHIALVVDVHGATRGLVTLEDLIETLIGVEIIDEVDKIEDMRAFARKLWIDRARALGIENDIVDWTHTESDPIGTAADPDDGTPKDPLPE